MRGSFLALTWSFGAMLALECPVRAQTADSQMPVSVERIRAGLQRPPPLLKVPPPSADIPTFRTEVRAHVFGVHPLDEAPPDPTFGLPSAGELLMSGLEKVRAAVADYRRRRAERRARQEVDEALAEFCSVRDCPAP